jgi:S-adenosylmethionine/arginine decarboxylase-like enzyme
MYGQELILDVHKCDPTQFTRERLTTFFEELCRAINMTRAALYFWDYEGEPEEYALAPDHLKGVSAVQFIQTSNVTVHTLDVLKRVYLNIFSCKEINVEAAKRVVLQTFGGEIVRETFLNRE